MAIVENNNKFMRVWKLSQLEWLHHVDVGSFSVQIVGM